MFNGKYNSFLTVLLIVAIIIIIALLGYLGYSLYNGYYIDTKAKEAVDAFEQLHLNDSNTTKIPDTQQEENIVEQNIAIIEIPTTEDEGTGNNNSSTSKNNTKKTTLNGYSVIGTISIPAINITYPILDEITSNALKTSVVYLYGPGPNEIGNTVIQGHNYRNGKMFSNLYKLKDGADIYITDSSGNKVQYTVYRNFEANASDASFYKRDTAGKREITLSTCTDDANTRTIIFAREV